MVAALVAAPFLFRGVDEQIRARIEAKIGANYPHLNVRIRSAQLVDGQGIEVRGLSIIESSASGPQAELLYLDEMLLVCDTSLQSLACGEPRVTHVRIRRPLLRSTRRSDGVWSSSKLLPLPRLGGALISGTVENGTVEIFDPLKNPSSTLTLRDVQLSFKPSVVPGGGLAIAPSSNPGANLIPIGPAASAQRWLDMEGAFSAEQVQRVEFSGAVDLDSQRWAAHGRVEGLEVSPELRNSLPGNGGALLAGLGSLRGKAELSFRAQRDRDQPAPIHYETDIRLVRGRIDDPRLPYPLVDLKAHVLADSHGLTVQELTAHNGETSFKVSGHRRGWAPDSPFHLTIDANQVRLDKQLAKCLPPALRAEWRKFDPEGEVNVRGKLDFDGAKLTTDGEMDCINVGFAYYKFPYRLERCAGSVTLRANRMHVNVSASAAGRTVRMRGDLDNPGERFTGGIEVEADHIPFDEKLFAAMAEPGRDIVRSLRPQGAFNVRSRVWRQDPLLPPHEDLELRLEHCSMNYEKFPYPIADIHGVIERRDQRWTFRDLAGANDTAQVHCQGTLAPVDGQHFLKLSIAADNVPLDEELHDALAPNARSLWTSLKPRGSCDLRAEVTYLSGVKQFGLRIDAKPRPESTSIEPVAFPYRMEKLRGAILYQDGRIELENMEAEHGRTHIASGGRCDFLPDGRWTLQLKKLSADRVRFDHELTAALPEGLRKTVLELKPNMPVNLRGSLVLSRGVAADAPLTSEWDVTVDLSQMTLDAACRLENIYGSLQFAGAHDGQRFYTRGELALDSLTYKNFQFTQVMGPLWVDNGRLLVGAWAESKQSQSPRRVTGKLFGGTVLADGQVLFGATPQFNLHAILSEADLPQFAREHLSGEQNLKGKVLANLQLQGNSKGTRSLVGDGSIRLHDADIYELPSMVQLLKILSVRRPDKTAFTQSEIDFRIQGDYVVFDRIDFRGDAISLLGRGQMTFDEQVNMTFRAEIGRGEWKLPVVRTVLSEASQQVMQIHVDGAMEHPNIRREAFPGVNQALQQLQAELQNPGPAPPASPQARRLLPALLNNR